MRLSTSPFRSLACLAALLALAGCATDFGVEAANTAADEASYGQREGALGAADYGPANWVYSPNFTESNRVPPKVTVIVVHTTQGSYNGAISWFQNTTAQVSAHYVISKGGAITNMVHEKDIGWHVGSANGYTIGIEHEGFVDDPTWVTEAMLQTSSQLTCYLLKKWGLPATKDHVKGHVELPNQTHTDPGKYWPWDKYMGMVQACVNGDPPPVPGPVGCCGVKIPQSGEAIIDDAGNDCIQKFGPSSSWWTGDKSTSGGACGYGGSMTYTYTSTKADAENWARWRLTFAKAGKYHVEAWIPNNFASSKPTYVIHHAGVNSSVQIDQKPLSDVWVDLGTYDFAANCDEYVSVGDNTGQAYSKTVMLGVDAIRVTANGPAPCPASCDDSNACTDDTCVAGQCVHGPNTGAACWDGDACTVGEACQNGACTGGKPAKDCNDNNVCTDDGCSAGTCTHGNNAAGCDDGNGCTSGDHCQAGACVAVGGATCDDKNPCTTDTCAAGACSHVGLTGACDDGNACSQGDHCANGKCLASPVNCDDGDGCTVGEACVAGGCVPGKALDCNDGNPCTDDACLGGQCSHGANGAACDDGNDCTSGDLCSAGKCAPGKGKPCDDGKPCTIDSCVQGTCVATLGDGACDDGDGCTTGDYCAQGNCLSGASKNCDDGLACTQDACKDGQCTHAGELQIGKKVCQSRDVLVPDPCGGPPKLEKCAPEEPCLEGECGGPRADAVSGDSAASQGDGRDGLGGETGSGGDAGANYTPAPRPSGCAAGSGGSAGAGLLLLAAIAGLLGRRRVRVLGGSPRR